jgi:hypothetical protein
VRRPRIDESLTLLSDFGQTGAICTEVFEDPAREQSVVLKVLTRGPFEHASKSGLLMRMDQKVAPQLKTFQTLDSEVTLSTVLPA